MSTNTTKVRKCVSCERNSKTKAYYLGFDGTDKWWLLEPSWDCDWYWGLGYVRTYTNHGDPCTAKDLSTHMHFDYLFLRPSVENDGTMYIDAWKKRFVQTPFSDKEIWKILELMKCMYTARHYADMLLRGGGNISHCVDAKEIISNPEERERINKEVIPGLWKLLKSILAPSENTQE